MKKNLELIAAGNAGEAINAYDEEILSKDWMNEVDEDEIYAAISTPEFEAYMEILGLAESDSCHAA